MTKSKRQNYLIDKQFQLGFIAKYLFIIFFTLILCFGLFALYYYQISLLGTKKLDQNIEIKTRSNVTVEGYKVFEYDKEQITLYQKIENGKNVYYCLDPFNNTNYKNGDLVQNVDESQLKPGFFPQSRFTKLFYVVIPPLLWLTLMLMVVITIFSIFFSHRMAGPIYRIRVSLDRMLAGDFDFKIKVRRNDFFINIAEKLEQLRLKTKNGSAGNSKSGISKEKVELIRNLITNDAEKEEIIKKIDSILE